MFQRTATRTSAILFTPRSGMFIARETNRRERLLRAINMRTPNGVETASAVGPRQQNSMSFHWVAVLQLCLVLRWNQGCRRLAPRRRRGAEVRRGSGHSRIKQFLV